MGKIYDVAIIGGGIGGLMAAYQLTKSTKNVLLIDSGDRLEKRHCYAVNGKACIHCKTCAITSGLAGAGAFSDGKFNLGTAYGGTLGDELGENLAMEYINMVDSVLEKFSDEYAEIYKSDESLKLKCIQNDLQLLDMNVRHLGTDKNYETMKRLIEYLDSAITIKTRTTCLSIYANPFKNHNEFVLNIDENNNVYNVIAQKVIVATGRGGADFVNTLCNKFNVQKHSNSVDIGVRVEMKDIIWKEFSSKIYEPKILYRTPTFGDRCRMFCFNQGGVVSAENNHGIITANGHSFADLSKKTDNCNFAILSSIHFTEPFNQPTEYAENISKLANMIGDGNVIVQRLGDLKLGRRTNEHRLKQNSVIPTLNATPGDLSLVLPHRILTNIVETLDALNRVAPGTSNPDTLLYGCESKYYSIKPEHNKNFEIAENLYLIGDGSGICRGLSQSGAMGLYVADKIMEG
jgi:uncharacterized FAD-dependent dehydrogenase